MFPRGFLLVLSFCLLHCIGYSQEIEEATTPKTTMKTTVGEPAILASIAACSALSVLIVLLPTISYYKYFKKEEDTD